MSKHRPTSDEREIRREARQEILQAANTFRLRMHRHYGREAPLTLLTERHLQRAVCIVRRRRLVSRDCLTEAGYRAVSR